MTVRGLTYMSAQCFAVTPDPPLMVCRRSSTTQYLHVAATTLSHTLRLYPTDSRKLCAAFLHACSSAAQSPSAPPSDKTCQQTLCSMDVRTTAYTMFNGRTNIYESVGTHHHLHRHTVLAFHSCRLARTQFHKKLVLPPTQL